MKTIRHRLQNFWLVKFANCTTRGGTSCKLWKHCKSKMEISKGWTSLTSATLRNIRFGPVKLGWMSFCIGWRRWKTLCTKLKRAPTSRWSSTRALKSNPWLSSAPRKVKLLTKWRVIWRNYLAPKAAWGMTKSLVSSWLGLLLRKIVKLTI